MNEKDFLRAVKDADAFFYRRAAALAAQSNDKKRGDTMKKTFKWILTGGALCAAIAGIVILSGIFAEKPRVAMPADTGVGSSMMTADSLPAESDVTAEQTHMTNPVGSDTESSRQTEDSNSAKTDETANQPPVVSGSETSRIPENSSSSAPVDSRHAELLADFLNEQLKENIHYTPYYEISETKTLLYRYRITENEIYYDIAVYDSSTGTLSDTVTCNMLPQCRENGFWVLKAADTKENAARFYGDTQSFGDTFQYASDLLMYDYDTNLIADVDLSGYGAVYAIEADLNTKSVYCAFQEIKKLGDEKYLHSNRLVRCSADGLTEKQLYVWSGQGEPHTLDVMRRMVLHGDTLFFTAWTQAAEHQNYSPAWGVFNCRTKKLQLHEEADSDLDLYPAKDCVFVVCRYQENDPKARYFVKKVLSDGNVTEFQIQNPMELSGIDSKDLNSGEFFLTSMTKEQTGSLIRYLVLYDCYGQKIGIKTANRKQDEQNRGYFLHQSTHTILVKSLENSDDYAWRTIRF